MWGLVLSAATIAISFLTEGRGDNSNSNGSTNGSASQRNSITVGRLTGGAFLSSLTTMPSLLKDRKLLSGALLGFGISLLCTTLIQQFRWSEQLHLWIRSWWYWETVSDLPLRVPVPLETAPGHVVQRSNGSHGTIRYLLSPRQLMGSTQYLNVATLTVPPGREVPPGRSHGTEFYYVMRGNGLLSQQGVAQTQSITTGDCFVVEIGRMRWISNPAVMDDLVLLRVTDDGRSSMGVGEWIRIDPNRRTSATTTTMDAIKDGFRHVHSLARDYIQGVDATNSAGGKSSSN